MTAIKTRYKGSLGYGPVCHMTLSTCPRHVMSQGIRADTTLSVDLKTYQLNRS